MSKPAKKVQLNVYIPEDLVRRAKVKMLRYQVPSMSYLVANLLTLWNKMPRERNT